ncbi:N-acetyltransferase [Pseudalkalibacillus sp. SCS-8]|uniref:GNAT family N-acetyltransferase n=1 Tax=Pseudalkalibacillus nanhaiensis TaxID=3115291 RepID=UPI0032DA72D6
MYSIRAEKPQDYAKIKQVNDLAFNQENEGKLIEALRSSDAFVQELSLVAETEDEAIIGHILFSKIVIKTEQGYVPSLALAPMSVTPAKQNQGVGSALVEEGLKQAGKLGFKSVIVLGHPEYYPRFGFTPASEKSIKPPFDVPKEVFMALELKPGALSGVEGVVQYPDAFMNV